MLSIESDSFVQPRFIRYTVLAIFSSETQI